MLSIKPVSQLWKIQAIITVFNLLFGIDIKSISSVLVIIARQIKLNLVHCYKMEQCCPNCFSALYKETKQVLKLPSGLFHNGRIIKEGYFNY